jgi:hypothetical protein
MPQLLTTNALITCPHGGKGTTIPSAPKWQINGGYVCVEGDTGTLACPFLLYPCVGYTLQSMGLNATTIDRRKAMLVTDFNQTVTGLPLLMAETHPVFDESVPASIPAGQTAPPLSPELSDLVKPVVVAPPSPFPFSMSAPAPVVISFSLASDHPLKWVLTLINELPPGQNVDLTNGIPGMATVVPSGGQWLFPATTVVVTLTPPFLAGLGFGKKDLFLTGVSRRGLSGHDSATIMVSA